MPLLEHCLSEKQDSKKYWIRPIGPSGFQIVPILLAEIIEIQM